MEANPPELVVQQPWNDIPLKDSLFIVIPIYLGTVIPYITQPTGILTMIS